METGHDAIQWVILGETHTQVWNGENQRVKTKNPPSERGLIAIKYKD